MSGSVKAAKIVRVLTVPPIMAFVCLTLLLIFRPAVYGGAAGYWVSLLFLLVLPILGYPLQPVLPHFKDGGREAQRTLASVMAVLGYIGGLIYAACARSAWELWLVYLAYFLSSILFVVFNKGLRIRASGHSSGVSGPIALLVCLLGWPWAALYALLVPVFWASLRTGRHTMRELLVGSVLPIGAVLLLLGLHSL